MTRVLTRSLIAAVATFTTACAGSTGHSPQPAAAVAAQASAGAGGIQQITVHATNGFRFSPSTIDAHVGRLRITVVDDGSYPHNISFPALHRTSTTVSGDPGAGRTTLLLDLTHSGSYRFSCTYHSSAGMLGQVDVR